MSGVDWVKRWRNPTSPGVRVQNPYNIPNVSSTFTQLANRSVTCFRFIVPHPSEVFIVIVALSTTAFLLSVALIFKVFLQLLVVIPPREITQPQPHVHIPKP